MAGAGATGPDAADPTATPEGVQPVDPAVEQAPAEGPADAGGTRARRPRGPAAPAAEAGGGAVAAPVP